MTRVVSICCMCTSRGGGAGVAGCMSSTCIMIAVISFIDHLVFLQPASADYRVVRFLWNQDCCRLCRLFKMRSRLKPRFRNIPWARQHFTGLSSNVLHRSSTPRCETGAKPSALPVDFDWKQPHWPESFNYQTRSQLWRKIKESSEQSGSAWAFQDDGVQGRVWGLIAAEQQKTSIDGFTHVCSSLSLSLSPRRSMLSDFSPPPNLLMWDKWDKCWKGWPSGRHAHRQQPQALTSDVFVWHWAHAYISCPICSFL